MISLNFIPMYYRYDFLDKFRNEKKIAILLGFLEK